MNLIQTFIHEEISYFQKLYPSGRKLILSYSLYNTMDPLLWTFATAFLWRLSQDVLLIAWYYIAIFIGLVIGFYANGKLLNTISSTKLYLFGCITQAIVVSMIIFFQPKTPVFIFPFGILFGVAAGFFWANRTFLTIKSTESDQRFYFTSLESITGLLAGVCIPILVGWFIVFGNNQFYSAQTAYKILSLVMILVMTIVGLLPKSIQVEKEKIEKVFLLHVSPTWNKMRLFTFIEGTYSAMTLVLPALMILSFIGNEQSLGILQSASSVVSAGVIYFLAKRVGIKQRIAVFIVGIVLSVLAWAIFGITYSAFGVLAYTILYSLGDPIRATATNPVGYDLIDIEEQKTQGHHFSLVFDWELFLDLGRAAALLLFIGLYYFFHSTAFRIVPFVYAMLQLVLIVLYKQFEQYFQKEQKHIASLQINPKPEYALD